MRVLIRLDDPRAVDDPLFSRFATISMGAPGRCPECDAFGYIEAADLAHCSQTQRCRDCGYRWTYQFDTAGTLVEVVEIQDARRSVGRPATDRRADVIDLTPSSTRGAVARR